MYLLNTAPKAYAKRASMPPGLTVEQARQFAEMVNADVSHIEEGSDGELNAIHAAVEKLIEVPWNKGARCMKVVFPEGLPLTTKLANLKNIWSGTSMSPPQAGEPPGWIACDEQGLLHAAAELLGGEPELLSLDEGRGRYEEEKTGGAQ